MKMKYRIKHRISNKIKIIPNEYGHKYSQIVARTQYYPQKKVLWWWKSIGRRNLTEYFQYKNDCKEFIKQYHYLHYGMNIKYEIIE